MWLLFFFSPVMILSWIKCLWIAGICLDWGLFNCKTEECDPKAVMKEFTGTHTHLHSWGRATTRLKTTWQTLNLTPAVSELSNVWNICTFATYSISRVTVYGCVLINKQLSVERSQILMLNRGHVLNSNELLSAGLKVMRVAQLLSPVQFTSRCVSDKEPLALLWPRPLPE